MIRIACLVGAVLWSGSAWAQLVTNGQVMLNSSSSGEITICDAAHPCPEITDEMAMEVTGNAPVKGAPVALSSITCNGVKRLCALLSLRTFAMQELDIIAIDKKCPADAPELASANDATAKFRVCAKR
jgi:hypothetical protein